jgi:hypothetical protein
MQINLQVECLEVGARAGYAAQVPGPPLFRQG